MRVVKDKPDLSDVGGCSFVPTMGALHQGHEALIRCAVESGRPAVVSIFVNPTQFAPHEDLDSYPRTIEQDLDLAERAGVDTVFVPEVEMIYPDPDSVWVPPLPPVATEPGLEDADRPHFFGGVCAVVSRLFDLVQPHQAFFGEKDWQQLKVVEGMVAMHQERWSDLKITGVPTARESDGLALSSRNLYLSAAERIQAQSLSRALRAASGLQGVEAERVMRSILEQSGLSVDYAVVRDAETLTAPRHTAPRRALIAARIGSVRLIDNADV